MHDEDPGKTNLPDCNFTSRIRCVNRFVIDYISDDHTLGSVFLLQYCKILLQLQSVTYSGQPASLVSS